MTLSSISVLCDDEDVKEETSSPTTHAQRLLKVLLNEILQVENDLNTNTPLV